MSEDYEKGFNLLDAELSKWIEASDNSLDALEEGAKEYVKDANNLPKPYRQVMSAGYTHLVKSITYRREEKDISVGWGKYYGPMLERGTIKFNAQPHLVPLWDKNRDKYTNKIIGALGV